MSIPRWLSGKESPAVQEPWVGSLHQEEPLAKEMVTHSSSLAWEVHGQRSLAGYSPWGRKELDTTGQLTLLLSFCNDSSPNLMQIQSNFS